MSVPGCAPCFGVGRSLPVCPYQQTYSVSVGMSQTCRYRKHCVARVVSGRSNETLANRRDDCLQSVTLTFSGMAIAPRPDSHQEASRLRLIRDGAFVASDH